MSYADRQIDTRPSSIWTLALRTAVRPAGAWNQTDYARAVHHRPQRRPSPQAKRLPASARRLVGALASAVVGHPFHQPTPHLIQLRQLAQVRRHLVSDIDRRQRPRGVGAPGGDRDRGADAVQRELGDRLVTAGAEDDPDRFLVVAVAKLLVHRVEVQVHLADVLGLERADLQVDHHEPPQGVMVEEQVKEELPLAGDLLPARLAWAESTPLTSSPSNDSAAPA